MEIKNWDYNTFLAFLLIYASNADMEFSDSEKEQIKQFVSPEKFEELLALFNNMTDYQVLELILSYKAQYFDSEDKKDNIFESIKAIFDSDGEYSQLEKELNMFLRKLM